METAVNLQGDSQAALGYGGWEPERPGSRETSQEAVPSIWGRSDEDSAGQRGRGQAGGWDSDI